MNRNFLCPQHNSNDNSIIYIPEKRNIVFLDIDGVIAPYGKDNTYYHDLDKTVEYVSLKYKDDIYKSMSKRDIGLCYYNWDPIAIGRLKKLLDLTDAEVVIHSDWRFGNTLETLRALFKLHAMDEYILDTCIPKYDKIWAINKYLKNHKINNYVIFDDDNDLEIFGDNFILTYNILNNDNFKTAYRKLTK